jgi:peptidase M23-like protein
VRLPNRFRIRVLSWSAVAVLTAASLAGLSVLSSPGLAQLAPGATQVTGSGSAAFSSDQEQLDACTFDISAEGGDPASGTFDCDMSQAALDKGIPFAHMDGDVGGLDELSDNEVSLSGTAGLELPDGSAMDGIPYVVWTSGGGPGEGWLRIRLTGVFDGEPGDSRPGNGDYDQRRQTVTDGSITIDSSPSPSPSETPSPSPSETPTPTPSGTPTPTPSGTPTPTPTPSGTPTPTPSVSSPPPTPVPTVPQTVPPPAPPIHDAPIPASGSNSTARLMALLAQLSDTGTPQLADILAVVGPFPVAGLAWWTNDWHAYRCCPYPHLHQGVDMFASEGTPLVAAADGYVSQKVVNAISGLGVEITDASNTQYFYAHLSRFAPGLRVGQQVRVGQVIGYVGHTGNASQTSPHLHFEVQPGGVPVPPKPFVDRWLILAEQKAEALVAGGAGRATLNPADLNHWLTLASALVPSSAGADADGGTITGQGVAALQDPSPGPAAGIMMAFASALLLFLLVAPACLAGRREAMRSAQRASGGGPSAPPRPSNPVPRRPDPPGTTPDH